MTDCPAYLTLNMHDVWGKLLTYAGIDALPVGSAHCCAWGDGSMLALQDMNVLHEQERKLAGKPHGWRDYYLATQSDTGVASFWRWLGTFAGKLPALSPSGPEPSGAYADLQGTGAACCNWPSCLLCAGCHPLVLWKGLAEVLNMCSSRGIACCVWLTATALLCRRRCGVV